MVLRRNGAPLPQTFLDVLAPCCCPGAIYCLGGGGWTAFLKRGLRWSWLIDRNSTNCLMEILHQGLEFPQSLELIGWFLDFWKDFWRKHGWERILMGYRVLERVPLKLHVPFLEPHDPKVGSALHFTNHIFEIVSPHGFKWNHSILLNGQVGVEVEY